LSLAHLSFLHGPWRPASLPAVEPQLPARRTQRIGTFLRHRPCARGARGQGCPPSTSARDG
jgi:hypothetical protein